MRPLKLHTKTTLLYSATTLALLAAALIIISTRVASLVRDDQKALAELLAINFADHISNMPSPRGSEAIAHAATLVRSTRPNLITVRVWVRSGALFVEQAAAAGSTTVREIPREIPEETRIALRNGLASKVVNKPSAGEDDSVYRVFAPITEEGRVSGAVEVVERLDNITSIAKRYALSTTGMALIAVFLLTFVTYLLFRSLVYIPIDNLLRAMSRARSGDLDTEVPVRTVDELGVLALEFNSMIKRVREMTAEREAQQETLRELVREATSKLQLRNDQLEEANRELWSTTRRLTELERLAAAGQTAAQFAHEVGTPLNLISGHIQLLSANLQTGPDATRILTIRAQIERIERIVLQMLDRTRFDSSRLVPLDLNRLLHRTFEAMAPALDARGVMLKERLDPALPKIAGDADRLQQVFINLISNALDAMPRGGDLKITTCVEETKNPAVSKHILVEFADTGSGMSEEV
ncbi:MAG: sensor histidine kinase, partial [Pyrinomonadaceae bacterium]